MPARGVSRKGPTFLEIVTALRASDYSALADNTTS